MTGSRQQLVQAIELGAAALRELEQGLELALPLGVLLAHSLTLCLRLLSLARAFRLAVTQFVEGHAQILNLSLELTQRKSTWSMRSSAWVAGVASLEAGPARRIGLAGEQRAPHRVAKVNEEIVVLDQRIQVGLDGPLPLLLLIQPPLDERGFLVRPLFSHECEP